MMHTPFDCVFFCINSIATTSVVSLLTLPLTLYLQQISSSNFESGMPKASVFAVASTQANCE
jgi:hypothetical protein